MRLARYVDGDVAIEASAEDRMYRARDTFVVRFEVVNDGPRPILVFDPQRYAYGYTAGEPQERVLRVEREDATCEAHVEFGAHWLYDLHFEQHVPMVRVERRARYRHTFRIPVSATAGASCANRGGTHLFLHVGYLADAGRWRLDTEGELLPPLLALEGELRRASVGPLWIPRPIRTGVE